MKSLYFDKDTKELVFLDRSALPGAEIYRRISTFREFFDSLASSSLCGNDAVFVSAAYIICAAAYRFEDVTVEGFDYSYGKSIDFLSLQCASNGVVRSACVFMKKAEIDRTSVKTMLESIEKAASGIENTVKSHAEALDGMSTRLISDGDGILVRGNCGELCTVKYGLSFAPVARAFENGVPFRLYIGETYPSYDGKRLASYEASLLGMRHEVIRDSDAASLMAKGKITKVFIDAVTDGHGNFASSPGSLQLAVCCKHYGVPIYAFLPSCPYTDDEKEYDVLDYTLLDGCAAAGVLTDLPMNDEYDTEKEK